MNVKEYKSEIDEDGIQLVAEILRTKDKKYKLICKAVATDGGGEETIHILNGNFLDTLVPKALSFVGG